jgi:hypothetical protein
MATKGGASMGKMRAPLALALAVAAAFVAACGDDEGAATRSSDQA